MCDTDGCGGGHEWVVDENNEDQEVGEMNKYKNNPKRRARCQKPGLHRRSMNGEVADGNTAAGFGSIANPAAESKIANGMIVHAGKPCSGRDRGESEAGRRRGGWGDRSNDMCGGRCWR